MAYFFGHPVYYNNGLAVNQRVSARLVYSRIVDAVVAMKCRLNVFTTAVVDRPGNIRSSFCRSDSRLRTHGNHEHVSHQYWVPRLLWFLALTWERQRSNLPRNYFFTIIMTENIIMHLFTYYEKGARIHNESLHESSIKIIEALENQKNPQISRKVTITTYYSIRGWNVSTKKRIKHQEKR